MNQISRCQKAAIKIALCRSRSSRTPRHLMGTSHAAAVGACLVMALMLLSNMMIGSVCAPLPPDLRVSSNTQSLQAGAENEVQFQVLNSGENVAASVYVTLSIPAGTGGASMILIGSDGRFFLGNLGANESAAFNATIYVSPTAAGGLYQVTLTLAYTYGTPRSESRLLGFQVQPINAKGAIITAEMPSNELAAGAPNNLTLRLTNVGDATASSVIVSLALPGGASSAPLALIGSDGRWTIPSLGAGESLDIPVSVYASPSAIGSFYQASVSLTYSDWIKAKQETRSIYLSVPSQDLPSTMFEVSISPQELRAGAINEVQLSIRNTASTPARTVSISIALPGMGASTSQYVLLGSGSTWQFAAIDGGEEVRLNLSIFVTPAASGTASYFTVTASYTDVNFKTRQQTNYLGVIARGSINLVVLGTSTFPQKVQDGKQFSMTATIINLGTAAAQSVIFAPSGAPQLVPASTSNIFLGDLGVNVPSSLTLTLIAQNATTGVYRLNLSYTYKDSLGQFFSSQLEVPVRITIDNASTSSANGSSGSILGAQGGGLFAAAIASVAIVGIILYILVRKRRLSEPRGSV
ncbi:MAG: NEW3 domain-containing protein [Candidatus Methanomethylicia archaeon]|nr:NEW3 domain-containing protein [Candidatus Methanomethylicia archaeon]